MPPALDHTRTIIDDFATHWGDLNSLVQWLSDLIDGRTGADVAVPPNTHPLDHFLGALVHFGNRERIRQVAEASGELLLKWAFDHKGEMHHDIPELDRLSGVLVLLEAIPAPNRVSSDLFYLARMATLGGVGPRGHDIRRQAMNAMALRPPTEFGAEQLHDLFCVLMEEPDYAVAAFGGLQRLSLLWSAEQLPTLLRTLRQQRISPVQVVWHLFRELEFHPELADVLGKRIGIEVDLLGELNDVLLRLRASEKFPTAWAAYQRASLRSATATQNPLNESSEPGESVHH